MNNTQKTKELPVYLAQIRTDLIMQISKLGLSMQNIADIFSLGITRSGVYQIINKDKKVDEKVI